MNKKLTEELKQEIISYYLNNRVGIHKVAEEYRLCVPTILKVLDGIPRWPKNLLSNPNLDENIFKDIKTEAEAYFLGFIITDGNIFSYENYKENTQTGISITQIQSDSYILEEFRKLCKCNNVISYDKHGTCQISIHSNKIAENLKQFGLGPRKTSYMRLPIDLVSEHLMHHVIRGIFDGDGSIMVTPYKTWYHKSIDICGCEALMNDLSNYFYDNLCFDKKPSVYASKCSNLWNIRVQATDKIYKFGEYIYKDATIFLKRKKDRYEYFKECFNLKDGNTEVTD